MTKKFDYRQVDNSPKSDWKANVVQVDNTIIQATLYQRRTFLGMFERWVEVADIMQPVKDVDRKIDETKLKLKSLESERESTYKRQQEFLKTLVNIYGPVSTITLDDKKPADLEKAFGPSDEKDKDKPKVKTTKSATLSPFSEPNKNQQNQNQRKN